MYNSIAKSYDELHGAEQETKAEIIIEYLLPRFKAMPKVLDIGCGTGIFLAMLGKSVSETTPETTLETTHAMLYGIDPSKEMLAIAKKKAKVQKINAILACAAAESIPFDDNSFDAVVAVTSAHNFSDAKKAFSEIKRVARPDAIIVISLLKKSSKFKSMSALFESHFAVKDIVEEEHDIIYFGRNTKSS